jgi:cysteinyl-tRNA synthetase
MEIKLNNSLSKNLEIFNPVDDNEVTMYSCGPTVYNYAHIGNMRAFLFADLLQRVLRVVGEHKVKWVMNITNIDDKTIRDSAKGSDQWNPEMGSQTDDPKENLLLLTKFYEKAFVDDISKLGICSEDFFAMPKATGYIDQMQVLIRKILDKGYAYISDGSVYFSVSKWRKDDVYGRLFKIDFENFREGERVDSDQYDKEEVSDFVLWKAKKENEPFWDFEIDGQNLAGRPGWHIECSAMEKELLGLPFDIHTGGIDLKFPHHEDEIAQSKAGYGIDPTVYWCHNEFLEVEGRKMSKSLGNFFTLRELLEKGIDPVDIRYLMLSAHYGTKMNFTFEGLKSTHKARMRVQDYIYDLHLQNAAGEDLSAVVEETQTKAFAHLASDLHTPKALAEIFTLINKHPAEKYDVNSAKKAIKFFSKLNQVFSAWEIGERKEEKLEIPQEVQDLAEERFNAKKEKNWAAADELRNKIQALGYVVKDAKDSYSIEKL